MLGTKLFSIAKELDFNVLLSADFLAVGLTIVINYGLT